MDFLTVDNLLQFIALLIGLLAAFIRFNNKTEKNTLLIVQLEKDVKAIKEEVKENYTKLENKISEVEDDIKSIAADIGEIKGYLKRLNDL
jgi:archaellum component FlaC